jgi:hypothetical protein
MTEPRTYRKKPVEIAASQWFAEGDHPAVSLYRYPPVDATTGEISAADDAILLGALKHTETPAKFRRENCGYTMHDHGWIDTLEGGHTVCPGDWIITGVQGEHYPCKPDIFEQTYDSVEA